jgi:DUF3040 family protein
MTLSKDERDALATIQQSLELDDPRLARKLRRMAAGPLTNPLDSACWMAASMLIGLSMVALGATLDWPGLVVPGLVIAISVPVTIAALLARHRRH